MSVPFEHCIRCTLCVENCPVFKVNEHYPGPKQAGPDAERFRLDGQKIDEAWIKYCTQCHRCQTACPYGVDPAQIIRRAQLAYGRTHRRSFSAVLFANNYYLGLIGSTLAPIFNRVSRLGLVRRLMQALGISKYLPFPSFYLHSLRISRKHAGQGRRKVAFFYGCFLNYNQPQLGRVMRDFLVSTGLEVVLPPQVCCGLPALGNGDLKTALRFAKKNAKVLGRYIEQGYDVVYACTSCGHTLTHDYPGVLGLEKGELISRHSFHLAEYLLTMIDEDRWSGSFGSLRKRIAYHIPCHLRASGNGYPAARLLEKIPGLDCRIFDEHCCGLAGSYGFKQANEETAIKLGKIAGDALLSFEPDFIVTDCGACRMQLEHFTGIPALDPLEILLKSLAAGAAGTQLVNASTDRGGTRCNRGNRSGASRRPGGRRTGGKS